MQAIILAGGFGTRLQSVVKDVPKPLADIDGKPFLAYLLRYLWQYGFTDCCISVGHLQEKIIAYFGDNYSGMKISYAREETPLGTGGAVINSLKYCDNTKPVFILNGDSFLKIDYKKLREFYNEEKPQIAMVLRKMEDCSRYGSVEIDKENSVKNFSEKKSDAGPGLINGGIYMLDPKIFSQFNLEKNFSFEKDFLMKYLKSIDIKGFVSEEYFIDIGIPDDYQKAQSELPSLSFVRKQEEEKNKALFLDRDGVINVDHGYVHKKENFDFVDGIFEICQAAQNKGYLIIVVTNQAGIAKGIYSEEQFLELTKWVENEFAKRGVKISKTFYCPYHKDAVIEKYRQDSYDRKPNPGMILKAIDEFNIDAQKSIMIGDKDVDMQAAEAASLKRSFLITQTANFTKIISVL